ncbi:MAG: OadG family protein [Prevotellaceae bacterium]|nr:OadG family protein [Prevotellaceae bacterium]
MRKIVLSLAVMLSSASMMFGQGANNIKINEVMTNNTENYLDEYGNHLPWVELVNNSFTTYNIRGMFITTDRAVLDEEMSVPERMKLMSIIPNGFAATSLSGRSHLLLFLNSAPEKGPRHLSATAQPGQELWIALYDGNAKTLIDSVTVKPLGANQSYARLPKDGIGKWNVAKAEKVTPECNNQTKSELSNIAKWKEKDPHGYLLSVQAMSITFIALILLFIFMKLFGMFAIKLKQKKSAAKQTIQTTNNTPAPASKTNEKEIMMAVIAMALDEYENDVHDNESGVITIQKKQTSWNSKQLLWQNKIQRQTRR